MIVAAAIRRDGVVWSVPQPGRHHDVIRVMVKAGVRPPINGGSGFVTDDGRFLDRIEAARHALECKQIEQLNWPPYPYSEDVW